MILSLYYSYRLMLFLPIKFKSYVQLTPIELDSKYQERIYEKLRTMYEGTCTKYGYIKPNSIEIVKRSCGNFMKQHFNGAIRFDVICRAEVCNPTQGSIVKAIIKNKNQLGILAESKMDNDIPILDIIIPIKSAGIISEIDLDDLSIGDVISVEVMGKKYQMKDTKISIIGRVIIEKKEVVYEITEEHNIEEEDDTDILEIDVPSIDDDDDDEEVKKDEDEDESDEGESDEEPEEDPIYEEEEEEEVEEEFEDIE